MVTTSITSDGRWPVVVAETASREPNVSVQSLPAGRKSFLRKIRGLLNEAVLLLVIVWLFPIVILLVGTPVALFVRLLIAIARMVTRVA
jgi:hypothetical protein